MFETVAPETYAPRSRKLFYETLPLSLALHAAFGAAFLVISLWEVNFPAGSPRLMTLYRIEAVPPPPPPPPPPAAAPKQIPVQQVQLSPKLQELAPTVIPDQIPLVLPQTVQVVEELPPTGLTGGVEGGIEGGVVGGSTEGEDGGEIGGTVGGEVGSIAPPDTVIVKRDMPLPTSPMSMVFPKYPEEARVRGWEDLVIVRYIIGKDGRVREVTILQQPQRELFAKVATKAIKNWRFRPYRKDGVPQEVVHELTIYFKLNA